jgi:hypothetical protein
VLARGITSAADAMLRADVLHRRSGLPDETIGSIDSTPPHRGDSLCFGESLRELDHPSEVLLTEAASVTRLQLSPQCGDNLCAICRTLAFEYLGVHPLAELQYRVVSAAFAEWATCCRANSIMRPRLSASVATSASNGWQQSRRGVRAPHRRRQRVRCSTTARRAADVVRRKAYRRRARAGANPIERRRGLADRLRAQGQELLAIYHGVTRWRRPLPISLSPGADGPERLG